MSKYPDFTNYELDSTERKVYYIIANSDISYTLLSKFNVDTTTQRIFFTKLTLDFLKSTFNVPNKTLEDCVSDFIRNLIITYNLRE